MRDTLPPDVLTDIVRCVLDEGHIELTTWSVESIGYPSMSPHARGLFRVRGGAATSRGIKDWSLILKAVQCVEPGTTSEPSHPWYWKREARAYQSGLLPDGTAGLVAPRCFGTTERSDTHLWLWLETIDETPRVPWTAARFARAATQMGTWSGGFGDTALPDEPWLSRGLLWAWIAASVALIADGQDARVWTHPLLRATALPALVPAIVRLWDEREAWCTILDQLPHTLCHHDLWRNNLLSRGDTDATEQTVVLDWETVGMGAVGEDIGNLIGVSLLNFDIDAQDAPRFAVAMLNHYADGLQRGGWHGDLRVMRAVAQATAALRCAFSTACWPAAMLRHPATQAQFVRETEQRWRRPIADIFAQWATVTAFLLTQAEDARAVLQPARR